MKNIEKGSIWHLIILIVAYAVTAMIIFPLFDLILYKLITHSPFEYSVYEYVTKPVIFGVIVGTVMWFIEKKKASKK